MRHTSKLNQLITTSDEKLIQTTPGPDIRSHKCPLLSGKIKNSDIIPDVRVQVRISGAPHQVKVVLVQNTCILYAAAIKCV